MEKPHKIHIPIMHELTMGEAAAPSYAESNHKEATLRQRHLKVTKPIEALDMSGFMDIRQYIDDDIRKNKLEAYNIEIKSVSPFIMSSWNEPAICTIIYEAYFAETTPTQQD